MPKCPGKNRKKLGSLNSENHPKSCPPVRSICLQGVPLIKYKPPEFLKSERLVSFDQTYSTITPAKLNQTSPNFVCSWTWMSSNQRCQDEPIWWSINRENCHGARATLTASWQPSLWRFTVRFILWIRMRITPEVQKKSSQIICQNVRAKIGNNWEV